MKIKEVRTRVIEWRGKTAPLPPHFCTNPMDLVQGSSATMGTFTFHGWLVVEIFTDAGIVGIGNASLTNGAATTFTLGVPPGTASGAIGGAILYSELSDGTYSMTPVMVTAQ